MSVKKKKFLNVIIFKSSLRKNNIESMRQIKYCIDNKIELSSFIKFRVKILYKSLNVCQALLYMLTVKYNL